MADDVLERATLAALMMEEALLVRKARPAIEPSVQSLDPTNHGHSDGSKTLNLYSRILVRNIMTTLLQYRNDLRS